MEELLEFFRDIDKLKHTERQGWKDIGVEGTRDTIASHSFGAAMLGWSLAEEEDIDSGKAMKMLLMHDMIMSYVEDYTPEDEEFDSKREKEAEAAEDLMQDVPRNIRDEFRELFQEFQAGETEAASFARECDKLDTLFQALIYSEELEEDHLSEFLESYSEYFSSDTGREIFQELMDSDLEKSDR
jgi:putative hydrolase of HD superfamily